MIQALLVGLFGAAVLVLGQLEIAQLNIADCTLRRDVDGLPNILCGSVELFAIYKRGTAEGVTVGRFWLKIDDLASGPLQGSHVVLTQRHRCESALRFDQVGTKAHSIPPFVLGSFQIAQQVESNAEVVVGYTVVGIVLEGIFQGFSGISGVAVTNLDLAAINQRLGIVGVVFQYFIIQFAS